MEPKLSKEHRHFRSRMDAIVQKMFEINYSQLIQYEILEKLIKIPCCVLSKLTVIKLNLQCTLVVIAS